MLATLPDVPPKLTDPALVYEPKYDGIRAIVEVTPGLPRAWCSTCSAWPTPTFDRDCVILPISGGVGGLWEGLRESAGVDLLAAIDHLKT